MDSQLRSRWKSAAPPFDGECLVLDQIELSQLRAALIAIVEVLRLSNAAVLLFRFDDWHEHDGFITERTATEWAALDRLLVDDDSLYASRQGDSSVHSAFYTDDFSFLLRYYVLDECDEILPGRWGRCDLCSSGAVVEKIKGAVTPEVEAQFEVRNAQPYFDLMYAG